MPYIRRGLPPGFEWIRGQGRHAVVDDRGELSETAATVVRERDEGGRRYRWTALESSGVVEGPRGLLKAKIDVESVLWSSVEVDEE